MRRTLFTLTVTIALLLMSCATINGARREIGAVTVTRPVVEFLDRIHKEFTGEIAICLTGYMTGDTLVVAGVEPTLILQYDSDSVVFRACDRPNHVGLAHNHKRGACQFSDRDRNYFEVQKPRMAR